MERFGDLHSVTTPDMTSDRLNYVEVGFESPSEEIRTGNLEFVILSKERTFSGAALKKMS